MISIEKIPRVVQHIIFWCALYIFNLLFWGSSLENLSFVLIINAFFTLFRILVSYFNIYVLIPKYLVKQKGIYFSGILFLITILSIFLRYSVVEFFYPTLNPQDYGDIESLSSIYSYSKQFLIEVYIQSIVMAVKLGKDWITSSRRTLELEEKHIKSELNFLKSQIQPHFFFNTLNNLYSLCKSDPDKAADSLLKLSTVMDYVLYRSSNNTVLLQDELTIVEEYISLESLRFSERLSVNFTRSEDSKIRELPPMILLSLIENSFKHGLHEVPGKVQLDIDIHTIEEFLVIKVTNTSPSISQKTVQKGIGLSNLEKRLQLIYNDAFEMYVEGVESLFMVKLKIPFHEH